MIDDDHGLARVVVSRRAHLAGTVAAAEDVIMVGEHASVQIEEETRVLVVPDSVYYLFGCSIGDAVKRLGSNHSKDETHKLFFVVAYALAVSVCRGPRGDVAFLVCLAVPYPRAAVHLYLRVAEDVGVGGFRVLTSEHFVRRILHVLHTHVAISAAEDAVAEHAALDVYKRIAVHSAVSTAAVDVAPYVGYDVVLVSIVARLAVGDVYERIAVDASYVFIMVGLCFRQTLATAIHFAEDGAATDVDERTVAHSLVAYEGAVGLIESCDAEKRVGRVICGRLGRDVLAHVGIVATAIHIAVNLGIVRDVHLGGADDTSHIDEMVGRRSCGFQTGATSEHVAVYACAAQIHLRLAANLSRSVVLGGGWVAEATAEHTMDEGLAVHRHLGAVSHRTSITAS